MQEQHDSPDNSPSISIWPAKLSPYVAESAPSRENRTTSATSELPSELANPPADFIQTIGKDIGRSVGYRRIAVHHIVLPPGRRTSYPHAESLEEEFVFVLNGRPDLWLNGYIHGLDEGYAVGFPAGTGVAHCFINNSESEVHLLVAGQTTMNENLCAFPINPELKATSPIWWENPPQHPLGPHSGLPGIVQDFERAKEPSPFVLDCKSLGKRKPFHYPGDNETFGEGIRITDRIGLKRLGIWYEYLPKFKRTSFPHAHTHEEEFAYVLKGEPIVWLDGFAKVVGPGWFGAFPSNTGLAHTLINQSEAEVVYLCIGETQDFADEKISYPLNPLRQKECRRKGWYWDDLNESVSGKAPAVAKGGFDCSDQEHLAFQLCETGDAEKVFAVFQTAPEYFDRVEGCPPSLSVAQRAIEDIPPKRGSDYFKESLLIKLNEVPIGFLDLHVHHPEKETCYVGLFLISNSRSSQGLGRKCYQLAEDYIHRALSCKKIRIGISNENDVVGFWQKMGFEFNGNSYNWKGEKKQSVVREFDKILPSK